MQESNEFSSIEPIAGEAPSERPDALQSVNENSASQNTVPPNFVEIYHMPVAPHEEEETDQPVDEESLLDAEQMPGKPSLPELEQVTQKKEPLPSDITQAAIQAAGARGDIARAAELVLQYAEQRRAEEQAEAMAAEKQRKACEESADQEGEEDLNHDGQSGPERKPVCQYGVKIGGSPKKTTELTAMEDLLRVENEIRSFRFVSAKDGVVDLFHTTFDLQWDLGSLYESLTLPIDVQGYGTTRDLFDEIASLFQMHVSLPRKECSLLAYWSIATWFSDYMPLLPSLVIRGPASTADLLLRTLAAVCCRPILLGELRPTILRKIPIAYLRPTLLIREPHLNRYTSALLNASNQPGYLFFNGEDFGQLYCPRCIYVGEFSKEPPAPSNSIQVNLGESGLRTLRPLPTQNEIAYFQNRLLGYRLLNHDKVAAANFRVPGFGPEIGVAAEALAAAVVDDTELQRGIIEVFKDRDEESRADRASGLKGVVLRAVLFHCHEKEQQQFFVREIAATTNRIYSEDGEPLKVSSETVGHVLKSLGLHSRRLGNAGRGLIFDKPTQSLAHKLGHSYDVLASDAGCTYCHDVQLPQSEEVVQDV